MRSSQVEEETNISEGTGTRVRLSKEASQKAFELVIFKMNFEGRIKVKSE